MEENSTTSKTLKVFYFMIRKVKKKKSNQNPWKMNLPNLLGELLPLICLDSPAQGYLSVNSLLPPGKVWHSLKPAFSMFYELSEAV